MVVHVYYRPRRFVILFGDDDAVDRSHHLQSEKKEHMTFVASAGVFFTRVYASLDV